ncbi:hypothetical protein IFT64_16225 [Oxalobacteraceae sp. CFBP 8753]|nr:hypothetical protein [Oxalobacteraceae sp. CFBP 8753]
MKPFEFPQSDWFQEIKNNFFEKKSPLSVPASPNGCSGLAEIQRQRLMCVRKMLLKNSNTGVGDASAQLVPKIFFFEKTGTLQHCSNQLQIGNFLNA